MDSSVVILGRQPELGLAELESLYGAESVRPVGTTAAIVELMPSSIPFARLGGAVKLCRVLYSIPSTKWPDIQRALEKLVPRHLGGLEEGKIQLGLSLYDLQASPKQIMAGGLTLKKALRNLGRSVRLTPNVEPALSSAQVLHNHLTGQTGCEIVLIRDGTKTICAQTVHVQDINAYTLRDRNRPKRDARVGMLPPKLAQIIVNLATGPTVPELETVVLDPFCGTGVVLQEAALMGYGIYGTDLEQRMIDYSAANLAWLQQTHQVSQEPLLHIGDATDVSWQHPFAIVACETYLGRPLSSWPDPEKMKTIINTCNLIIEKFLRNIRAQAKPGTRLCLALPAWRNPSGTIHHLPLLDHLTDLGYNRVDFKYVRAEQMVYYRPDQFVARKLLVLIKN